MADDLPIAPDLVIPAAELEWRFSTSGGPGGQHANRSSTRVELRYDLANSAAFDDAGRRRMLARLGGRARDGVVTVVVDESRSQWRNRQLARARLARLLADSRRRRRPRLATAPSPAARRRRLEAKRRRSDLKRHRRRPDPDH